MGLVPHDLLLEIGKRYQKEGYIFSDISSKTTIVTSHASDWLRDEPSLKGSEALVLLPGQGLCIWRKGVAVSVVVGLELVAILGCYRYRGFGNDTLGN